MTTTTSTTTSTGAGTSKPPWEEMRAFVEKVASGKDLTVSEAAAATGHVIEGHATAAQIGAFLVALRLKGEALSEIVGCAAKVSERLAPLDLHKENLVDACGTGGDYLQTFNVTTAAALVAAGAGIKVAKQGVSYSGGTTFGSYDVLRALGVNVDAGIHTLQRCMDEVGIVFLFSAGGKSVLAPAEQARREIGIRSIFNVVGPLNNPAGAKRQVIGVYAERLTELVAQVLKKQGAQHAMVVHGLDGLDEITTTGKTKVSEVQGGQVKNYYLLPEQFGLERSPPGAYRARTPEDSALIVNEVLHGRTGSARDIVVLNAGAMIRVAGFASSLEKAVAVAKRSIDSGRAREALEKLVKLTQD